jgi:hypothetical protein
MRARLLHQLNQASSLETDLMRSPNATMPARTIATIAIISLLPNARHHARASSHVACMAVLGAPGFAN